MDVKRPDALEGVELARVELTGVDFKPIGQPAPKSSAHVKGELQLQFDCKARDGDKTLQQVILHVDVQLQAFAGKPPAEGSPPGEKLMSCMVKMDIHYRIEKKDGVKTDIEAYAWYFQSHAGLLVRDYIRNLLKDTSFSSIPVPFFIQ